MFKTLALPRVCNLPTFLAHNRSHTAESVESVAVSFLSRADFTSEAIAELKALCVAKFTKLAAAQGISRAFAGIEGWRRLTYIEQAVIEAA
jgi:hypothetical protein